MSITVPSTQIWGALSQPIHTDAAAIGEPVWKDNAYLSFWDVAAQVFGTLHVSTSPNAPSARRARFSISVSGHTVEIVETLGEGTFDSKSIHFGLDGHVKIDHPTVQAQFVNLPMFAVADYATTGLIPALVPGRPLQHFQQACTVAGKVIINGAAVEISGHGMRDRTWGFRDEAAQWVEYAGLIAVDDSSFVTAMKFLGADGTLAADGFVIDERGSVPITDITFARNAAAQFLWGRLTLADSTTRTVSLRSRQAGFWVPMGPAETDGPAFGTYDDFMTFESDGRIGCGLFEQGIVHRAA
ncbi:hypothetical protein D1O33_26485 (plasmid) [Rhodococcus rhodochrous]|uniref:hypothetical protein n=1 Tax=Rhodococcus rhodochrous TaxID=1829 RepID=UPI00132EF922|nr:hypothetical protein [Rhodococcus rhodochrous]QHG85539.1 hypothetical protein D1O33_26485 [Rhodococcus rhodochrous]